MRVLVILSSENMSWGESLDAKTTKIARVPTDWFCDWSESHRLL